MSASWDFALLGRVVVRFVGAHDRHLQAAHRHLGEPAPSSAEREPAIVVTFRPDVAPGPDLRRVGEEAAYDNETFYLVRGGAARPRLVALPLGDLGAGLSIDCDAAIVDVPHLVPLVNVTALACGILPLHASAFVWKGEGVAVAGWSGGGKTEALLSMTAEGATPLADEWCYIDPSTRIACGMPSPIRLNAHHLGQDRTLRRNVTRGRRIRMSVASSVARTYRLNAARLDGIPGMRGTRWGHRLLPILDGQSAVDVDARRLYGDPPFQPHPLNRVVMVVATERRSTRLVPIEADEIVERMVAAHMHHRRGLLALYRTFRFAFPDRASPFIEELEAQERELLRSVIGADRSVALEHPHPVQLGSMRQVLIDGLADAG